MTGTRCIRSWRGRHVSRRYIAIWVPLGVLLAALLALQGVLGWTARAASWRCRCRSPYGFLCLSAWYVTGGSPLDRVGAAARRRHRGRSRRSCSSAVWLLIARGWMGADRVVRRVARCAAALPSGGADALRLRRSCSTCSRWR